jgi:hypothetical protein
MRRLSKSIRNVKTLYVATMSGCFGQVPEGSTDKVVMAARFHMPLAAQETSELTFPPTGRFVDFSKESECRAVTPIGDTDGTKLAR